VVFVLRVWLHASKRSWRAEIRKVGAEEAAFICGFQELQQYLEQQLNEFSSPPDTRGLH
jgi:hypothetical protein